jgi:hypothetical protein
VEQIELVTADEIQSIAREFFAGRQIGATVLGRVGGVQLEPQDLVC